MTSSLVRARALLLAASRKVVDLAHIMHIRLSGIKECQHCGGVFITCRMDMNTLLITELKHDTRRPT